MLEGPFRVDVAAHRYYIGDRRVPGVRSVLRVGGVEKDLSFLDPSYQARGKAVHEAACWFDWTGEDSYLPPNWRPFYEAYKAFREAVPCRWDLIETARVNRELYYASRVDRVGIVNGYPALVELKTGGPAAFHGPQLAGLDLLLGRGTRRRLGLYLTKDGHYKLKEYKAGKDYITFLNALRAYHEAYPNGETDDGRAA